MWNCLASSFLIPFFKVRCLMFDVQLFPVPRSTLDVQRWMFDVQLFSIPHSMLEVRCWMSDVQLFFVPHSTLEVQCWMLDVRLYKILNPETDRWIRNLPIFISFFNHTLKSTAHNSQTQHKVDAYFFNQPAVIHNSSKLWVAHAQYTLLDWSGVNGYLHLGNRNDITINNYYSKDTDTLVRSWLTPLSDFRLQCLD